CRLIAVRNTAVGSKLLVTLLLLPPYGMHLALRFHLDTKPALLRWRTRLGPTEEDRRRWYSLLLRVMRDRLEQYEGVTPEAVGDQRITPTVYWWQFTDELMIQYIVTEEAPKGRGWWDIGRLLAKWFRKCARTVIVIGLILDGDQAGVEAPRRG